MPRVREHLWDTFAEMGYHRFREHAPEVLALDTETTGLTWQDSPFGMSVSWTGPERIESFWFELEEKLPLEFARHLIADHAGRFIFYNAKFDIRMLSNFGLWSDELTYDYIDVMPAVALLDPTGEHKLKVSARKYLGVHTNQENHIKQARKELKLTKDDGYWPLPREVVVPYALKDSEWTLRLHDKLMPMIAERGLQEAFDKEMRLTAVLLKMEKRGLLTVPEEAKSAIRICDERIDKARIRIEELTGRKVGKSKVKVKVPNGTSEKTGRDLFKTVEVPKDFNPGAWQQIIEVFKQRGVHLTSTESKVLETVDDPLVEPLLTLRSEEKLRNTYLVPMLKEADENHILHPNFNQFGTITGRFSSGAARAT